MSELTEDIIWTTFCLLNSNNGSISKVYCIALFSELFLLFMNGFSEELNFQLFRQKDWAYGTFGKSKFLSSIKRYKISERSYIIHTLS